jgi:hypothetical protein
MTRLLVTLTLVALLAPLASGERRRGRQFVPQQRQGQGGARLGGDVIPLEANVSGVEGVKRPPGAVGFKLNATTFEFIGRNGQSLGVFPRDEDDIKKAGNQGAANNGARTPAPGAPGLGNANPGAGNNGGGAIINRAAKPVPFDGNRFNASFNLNPRDRIVAVEQIPIPRGATRYRLSDTQVQFLNARGQSLGIYPRDEDDKKRPPVAQNPGGGAPINPGGGAGNFEQGGLPPAAPDSFAPGVGNFSGADQITPASLPPEPYINPFTNHVMRPVPQAGDFAPANGPNNDTHGDGGRAPAAKTANTPKRRATAPEPTGLVPAPVDPNAR